MTIETFYQELGGNYGEVCARIPSEALIRKFVGSFLKDPSYESLCESMSAGNRGEAFRGAHTLKGVCANLGFGRLQNSASRLTEVLRPEADEIPADALPLMEQVRSDYQMTRDAITSFLGE